jgi:hypothetical protein
MLHSVALVRTYISEDLSASIIVLQEPHGVQSQKTPFFLGKLMFTVDLSGSIHVFVHAE